MNSRTRMRHEAAVRAIAHVGLVAFLVLTAYVVVLARFAGGHTELMPSIAATALVVAASSVLRPRVDRAVDRFVHGARADAFDDLQRFASTSRDVVDPRGVPARVVETAGRLVAAQHAELRLFLPAGRLSHVTWPERSTSETLDVVVPIRHEREHIGVLGITKHAGDPLSPTDETLLHRLATTASVALDNARLAIALREQVDEIARVVEELQQSSAHILSAGENEQRRVELAIRHRVERPLRGALADIRLATAVSTTRPAAARRAVAEASACTTDALNALRDVAHGVFPPLLASEGLARAVAGRGRRDGWRVDVRAEDFDDALLEPEARSAAYFALVELARTADENQPVSIALRAAAGYVRADVDGARNTGDSELARALERVRILGGTVHESEHRLSIALPFAVDPRS